MGQSKERSRDARDCMLAIDSLIKTRIEQMLRSQAWTDDDHVEFLKREITDYFLQSDGRKGVYVNESKPVFGPPRP